MYIQIVLFDLYSKPTQTIKEKNSNEHAFLNLYLYIVRSRKRLIEQQSRLDSVKIFL